MTSKIFLDERQIEKYKQEYAETGCIFLPGFLEENTKTLNAKTMFT